MKNCLIQKSTFDALKEANPKHLDVRYGMYAKGKYRKEETGKEIQLQETCIQDKRGKTWIQS